jgi:ribonuclease D
MPQGLEHSAQREEIVSQPEELAACCAYLATCPRIGFDTEFVGEDTFHPRLCLVQVAAPERLFLIDPLSAGPLDAFWQLLVDPGRQVVVHAGREEVRLCRLWAGQAPGNLFDLQLAAGLVGLPYPLGHGTLVNHVLGVHLPKGETLTEWRHRPLTTAQVRYAFDDVRHLLAAAERLTRRLDKLGRLDWAHEEFARLAASAEPDAPGADERWRKLSGLGSLDRRRLAVVRALYDWRQQMAERTNRPARQVVRDDLLVEIARRGPSRERDLQVVRGLQRRFIDDIVRVVQEARALPLEECPTPAGREQDPPQVALVGHVLNAVLGDLCARQRLAPSLVTTSADVKGLVRARLSGEPLPETTLTRGWRAAHVLPELLAVLDGRRLLRIANVRAEAPFGYEEVPAGPAENLSTEPRVCSPGESGA